MNNYLFIYTTLICVLLLATTTLIYFSVKKEITFKDGFYIFLGWVLCVLVLQTSVIGEDISKKMSFEIKAPQGLYSPIDEDSTITKESLYQYLINTRISNPKIIYCQAILESSNFTSELYKKNNNLFGMKLPKNRITSGSGVCGTYQKYHNWRESVSDYMLWVIQNNASSLDESSYLKLLSKIYAEDPKYIEKLKNIINNTNFEKL